MIDAITKYKEKALLGSVNICLFYFAGHAVSIAKENYLLPIDSDNTNENRMKYMGFKESDVINELKEINGKSIVILDACRNPFSNLAVRGDAKGGLSASDGSNNFFIAYSTAPNTTAADGMGRNSPFTKHLLNNMKPGVKIQDILITTRQNVNAETGGKQTPWSHDSLLEKVCLDE